jgi:hypothetical protein
LNRQRSQAFPQPLSPDTLPPDLGPEVMPATPKALPADEETWVLPAEPILIEPGLAIAVLPDYLIAAAHPCRHSGLGRPAPDVCRCRFGYEP